MSHNLFFILMNLVSAFVMLFELRALMQSSNVDYYHPFTQAVTKLTNPLVNIPAIRSMHLGSFYIAGFIVALALALAFWVVMGILYMNGPVFLAMVAGFMMVVKCFGYLVIMLLLAQALTSWLPSTRALSYLFSQITEPITSPVQRIIPPIGMIDISLMIVLIAIYALNGLLYKLFFAINPFLGQLWGLV